MTHFLSAALRYAELGYRVFPCIPGRKSPLTKEGFHNASTDPQELESWWQVYPYANIGLATDGLLVIDLDGRGTDWRKDQFEHLRDLARGAVAVTPREGRHYYFRLPVGRQYRCSAGGLAAGVDVRSTGGYVLVAPSQIAGKAYRWAEGLELEVPVDQLPEPPDWLIDELDRWSGESRVKHSAAPRSLATPTSNAIPVGQRNATLASLAGTMRRVGMATSEVAAALQEVNAHRCNPPLDADEVHAIASSVTRYEPDQFATAIAENHYGQVFGTAAKRFTCYTSPELDAESFPLNYLVENILVEGQPALIAAPKKSLKTNLSIDLALSLAHAGIFVRRFGVPRAVRVGVMSGESGPATIQETARRIAIAKGMQLADFGNVLWSFDLPRLGDKPDLAALRDLILVHGLEVIILDPAYLMMPGVGDNAGNLFVMGEFLKPLSELTQETGCTPIICHHLKKSIAGDPFEPPELENISWAGFQEWARQWILLNRRVRYDPERGGHHELWMSVGGSAGHSGAWGINVDEGTRQDAGGRRWDVEVVSAADAYAERSADAEETSRAQKQRGQLAREQRQGDAVRRVLQNHPAGETLRVIRELAGVNTRAIGPILEDLIERGEVERCEVQKNTRKEPAYRLAKQGGGDGGT